MLYEVITGPPPIRMRGPGRADEEHSDVDAADKEYPTIVAPGPEDGPPVPDPATTPNGTANPRVGEDPDDRNNFV